MDVTTSLDESILTVESVKREENEEKFWESKLRWEFQQEAAHLEPLIGNTEFFCIFNYVPQPKKTHELGLCKMYESVVGIYVSVAIFEKIKLKCNSIDLDAAFAKLKQGRRHRCWALMGRDSNGSASLEIARPIYRLLY